MAASERIALIQINGFSYFPWEINSCGGQPVHLLTAASEMAAGGPVDEDEAEIVRGVDGIEGGRR